MLTPIIKDIQGILYDVKKEINAISDKFHKMVSLKNVTAFMENLVKKANDYKPLVIQYDGYR